MMIDEDLAHAVSYGRALERSRVVVTVTDKMVESAAIAFYSDPPGHGRCINDAMKAAIVAALQEQRK